MFKFLCIQFQKKLQSLLSQKPDENPQNGEVFDQEAYLRNVEQFEDVEVVISGRNNVRVDRKQVKNKIMFFEGTLPNPVHANVLLHF